MDSGSLPERMLDAYLGLCAGLWNNRITAFLSFNEAMVCNFLYKGKMAGKEYITATELCDMTNISKSQMNKILGSLEKIELIRRSRSVEDKRIVEISLNEEKIELYEKEHSKNISIVNKLQSEFGNEKSEQLTQLLSEFVEIIDRKLKGDRNGNKNCDGHSV